MGIFDKFFGPPSKEKFARLLKDAIEKAGETNPIHYDPEEFCLKTRGEEENTLNLINAYNEYCGATKEHKTTVFRNIVQTWFAYRRELPDDFESAKHDLLPGIRNRMLFEGTRMRLKIAGKPGIDWPYRVLADVLALYLVYDLPASMMQIQQSVLDQWKTTLNEALEIACENLRAITKHSLNPIAPGVWISPWRDNYDASRMLLLEYVRHHEITGDPVVMVPNRDTLLLTGSDDPAGLAKMVEIAEAACEHPRFLSASAFRLTETDEWVSFLPSPQQPQYKRFRLLQLKGIGTDYKEQKVAVDELHGKTGKDVFVASYFALEKTDTGEIRSYCAWSAGVVTFLPKTDYIYFFRPRDSQNGDIVATVSWAEAEAVLGDRIKPVGIYPERYLVEGFPTEEEIAALGFQ